MSGMESCHSKMLTMNLIALQNTMGEGRRLHSHVRGEKA